MTFVRQPRQKNPANVGRTIARSLWRRYVDDVRWESGQLRGIIFSAGVAPLVAVLTCMVVGASTPVVVFSALAGVFAASCARMVLVVVTAPDVRAAAQPRHYTRYCDGRRLNRVQKQTVLWLARASVALAMSTPAALAGFGLAAADASQGSAPKSARVASAAVFKKGLKNPVDAKPAQKRRNGVQAPRPEKDQ